MFNLSEYRHKPQDLADFLPWAALVAEGIVLNKDGSLTTGWNYQGPDLNSATAEELQALTQQANRVLIAGDQVLPKITTNVSVWSEQPRLNPLRLYLDSLDRFQPMPADTLVLPSHGLPFRGLHARLEQLRDHHAARLSEALDALVEPRTAGLSDHEGQLLRGVVPAQDTAGQDPHRLLQQGFFVGTTAGRTCHST